MTAKDTYTYKIPVWAVCAIEYDDYTGLTDTEENSIRSFLAELPENGCFDFSNDEYFSYNNDVDNLGEDVIDAVYTVFE